MQPNTVRAGGEIAEQVEVAESGAGWFKVDCHHWLICMAAIPVAPKMPREDLHTREDILRIQRKVDI